MKNKSSLQGGNKLMIVDALLYYTVPRPLRYNERLSDVRYWTLDYLYFTQSYYNDLFLCYNIYTPIKNKSSLQGGNKLMIVDALLYYTVPRPLRYNERLSDVLKDIRVINLIKFCQEKIFRSLAKKLSVVWKTITLSNLQK